MTTHIVRCYRSFRRTGMNPNWNTFGLTRVLLYEVQIQDFRPYWYLRSLDPLPDCIFETHVVQVVATQMAKEMAFLNEDTSTCATTGTRHHK